MKWLRLAVAVFAMALLALSTAWAEGAAWRPPTFIMPGSLIAVEESAFEGTAAMVVILPEGAERLEERSFALMPNLRVMFIPESVHTIGESAFDGTHRLTFVGIEGSAAQGYARQHGFAFMRLDLWLGTRVRVGEVTAASLWILGALICALLLKRLFCAGLNPDPGTCPKIRPEMYPLDYDFP